MKNVVVSSNSTMNNSLQELAKEFGLEVFQVPNTSEKVKPEDFDGKLVKKGV